MSATILLVDDEPGILEVLARDLGGHGYEVVAVGDGSLAVEKLQQAEFDIVITDVRMPGCDGIDVLKATKEATPGTEVIVMTAHAEIESAIECVHRGAFDLLLKPFEMTSLVAIVARAVERRDVRAATSLQRASRVILSNEEPSRLPELVVEVTMHAMGADDVSLMLQGGDNKLYIAHSHGLSTEIRAETQLALGERVAGRVAGSREPVLIANGLAKDPRFADIPSFGIVHSSVVCPLAVGERLVGVLNISRVADRRPFRQHDLEKAEVLASQVLLALENWRLVEQIAATERLASVGQLAAGVAHELSSPASYALASLFLLRERLDGLLGLSSSIEQATTLQQIHDAWQTVGGRAALEDLYSIVTDAEDGAGRIRDIARDLQSLARPEGGRPHLLDLNDVIRSALRISGAQLRGKAQVMTELGTNVQVQGHAGRLSQVFINLLVNAAHVLERRTSAGGEVTVTTCREGERIVARVRDNGRGIAPADLPRIFEAFFTTKEPGIGTGLGLALSQKIVRDHGGDISVESSTTETVFTVVLPAAGSRTGTLLAGEQAGLAGASRSTVLPLSAFRLLLVDDDQSVLRAFQRGLGHLCHVTSAEGGREAIAALEQARFDLVLCDLLMPEMNGMEVFDHVRRTRPELCEVFVFMTGSIAQPGIQAFLKRINNRVLEKPFELSVLNEIIEARLRAKKTD